MKKKLLNNHSELRCTMLIFLMVFNDSILFKKCYYLKKIKIESKIAQLVTSQLYSVSYLHS